MRWPTTRLGEEMFAASRKKSLAFIAVDALADEDAERLIEEHQSGGQWPSGTAAADAAATRDIVRKLGGFTLGSRVLPFTWASIRRFGRLAIWRDWRRKALHRSIPFPLIPMWRCKSGTGRSGCR